MKNKRKFIAAATAFSFAAAMTACGAPTIGKGSAVAMSIDGYDVPAGVFIFYTLNSYYEAQSIVAENNTSTVTADDVKDSHIDNLEAADWIQNKATEYCENFVAIEKEFEKIGAELTPEDLDEIEEKITQFSSYEIYKNNGIGESSIRALLENESKTNYVFDYYYGFDSENGMSEEELKDFFDENFARVKYVSISLLDSEGNELDEDGKEERRELAEKYAKQINAKSDVQDKLFEVDAVKAEYDEYIAEQQAASEDDEATTTTTTTTTASVSETTTTTTTDPYANEYLMQKNSTTTAGEKSDASTVTTTTESESTKSLNKLKDYIFDDLELNKAEVCDDGVNTLYVVIRADLRERMTSDDYWTDEYIFALQSMNYDEDFSDLVEEWKNLQIVDKNKSAYRRYSPFKLVLETSN